MQWIKDPTAVAQVAAEAQVQSPTQGTGLRDLALLQLRLRFNFHLLRVQAILKKKKRYIFPDKYFLILFPTFSYLFEDLEIFHSRIDENYIRSLI